MTPGVIENRFSWIEVSMQELGQCSC